ncbi:MAG: hypothetical protein M1812_007294 [Candelaria pacifica]|nr:MAG: hypothetical protein M1812_007294 [Candelaria pacifica]
MADHSEHLIGNGTLHGFSGVHEAAALSATMNNTEMPSGPQPNSTEEPGLEAESSMIDSTASDTPSKVEGEHKTNADKISHVGFKQALDRYAALIAHLSSPSKASKSKDGQTSSSDLTLQQLDHLRLQSLPTKLQSEERVSAPFLSRDEVESLLRWKLKHGTFRPRLMELLLKNEPTTLLNVTKSAFKTYEENPEDYVAAIKELISLTGIGPATASLLLSVYDPLNVPFFSDEGFRWIMFEDGPGNGWGRKIKYNLKQYQDYFMKVKELRERLSKQSGEVIKAVDVEKVGFVLGKEAAGVVVGVSEPSPAKRIDIDMKEEEDEEEPQVSPPPLTKKRGRASSAKTQTAQNNEKKASQIKKNKASKISTIAPRTTKTNAAKHPLSENTSSEDKNRRSKRLKLPKTK